MTTRNGTRRVLALSNDDMRAMFNMDDCVRLLEEGFVILGSGEAANPLRVDRSVRATWRHSTRDGANTIG